MRYHATMLKTTSLGQFIRDSRLRAGFTKQEAIADVLGCKGQYIHLLETGKTIPSLKMALKLQRVLHIDRNKLVSQVVQIKIDQKVREVLRECEELNIEFNHYTRREVIRHVDNEIQLIR